MIKMQDDYSLSPETEKFLRGVMGRIRDTDTHEMFPARLWAKEYGEELQPLADMFLRSQREDVPNSFTVQRIVDDQLITREDMASYWAMGCLAPGAFDMDRRLEFMDLAGIKDSLVFGTALPAIGQKLGVDGPDEIARRGIQIDFDQAEMKQVVIKAYNDWCARVNRSYPRLRAVPLILTANLQEAIAQARQAIRDGARAVLIPASQPIGGRSPAHPDNDEFWTLLADHDVAVLLHIGSEHALLREPGWTDAPLFASTGQPSEHSIDPYFMATMSLGAQNYLSSLVLGAVFERVPHLRFGVMELGAHWVGPTAENLDIWASEFARRYKGVLTMSPSEYVQRNVRVSPFHFEPVDKYIERFPFLADVYCFSSDYPHYEGGNKPIEHLASKLQHFGTDVLEKFFVTNAEWLMPSGGCGDVAA